MIEYRLARALDDCLVALSKGESREQCLVRHAGLRRELEPLLAEAEAVRFKAGQETPWARSAVRAGVMEAIAREPRKQRIVLPAMGWRTLLAPGLAMVIAIVALIVGLGASQAPNDAEAATILTIIEGEVSVETRDGLTAGVNGMHLRPGDRVVTQPGARAVLTFFEGSTVTLDSDTAVVIRSVAEIGGELHVSLQQQRGNTWTHIPEALGPAQVEIDTPSARVQSREASFETHVTNQGRTDVDARGGGAIAIESGTQRTDVPSGFRASVDVPGNVATPTEATRPVKELVVQINGRAFASLTDPRGATAGTVAPGLPVNQVPGASVDRTGDQLLIRIPNPLDGTYRLGLDAAVDAQVSVSAVLKNGDGPGLNRSIDLDQDANVTVDFSLNSERLSVLAVHTERQPALTAVVVPQAAVDRVNAVNAVNAGPASTGAQPAGVTPIKAANTPTRTATPTNTPPVKPTLTPTPRPRVTPATVDDTQPISPSKVEQQKADSVNPSSTQR